MGAYGYEIINSSKKKKEKKPLVAYGDKKTKVTQNKIYPVH